MVPAVVAEVVAERYGVYAGVLHAEERAGGVAEPRQPSAHGLEALGAVLERHMLG